MEIGRDVVHVAAEFVPDSEITAYKKFAIDPNITNYGVLLAILGKCFNSSDFSVSYLTLDGTGKQIYVPLVSDHDLAAAISTSSVPCLRVKVVVNSSEEMPDGWNIVLPNLMQVNTSRSLIHKLDDLPIPNTVSQLGAQTSSMLSSMSQRFSKTVANIHRAITMRWDGSEESVGNPITTHEFRQFWDQSGRGVNLDRFFWDVYCRGMEHNLRKVGWCFLLTVCPVDATNQDRISFLQSKARQYQSLKQAWKLAYLQGRLCESQLATLASVSIDVVRTDWTSSYYKGEENRHRVCQLFDLLATYSVYHPTVGYNQGMSDLASPLLLVHEEEALAYFSFCSLMERVKENFHCSNQRGLIGKMHQLYDMIIYFDPHFGHFLRMYNLSDMYFTQRWLMLELKREFSMDDGLRLFEIQWAAAGLVRTMFQTTNPKSERHLILTETLIDFIPPYPNSTTTSTQTVSSIHSYKYLDRDIGLINSLIGPSYMVHLPNGKRWTNGQSNRTNRVSSVTTSAASSSDVSCSHLSADSDDASNSSSTDLLQRSISTEESLSKQSSTNFANRRAYRPDFDSTKSIHYNSQFSSVRRVKSVTKLPPPHVLGHGNPFLLFLCLSLLLEYRDNLLATVSEASDIIAFYQRTRGKHNLLRVLNRGRTLFNRYLEERKWTS